MRTLISTPMVDFLLVCINTFFIYIATINKVVTEQSEFRTRPLFSLKLSTPLMFAQCKICVSMSNRKGSNI